MRQVATQGRRRDLLRRAPRQRSRPDPGCLTDDIAWDLLGFRQLRGKAAFDGEIENDAFVGSPTPTDDRLIEDATAATVVAIGTGAATQTSGEVFRFAFRDIFTFAGDLIARLESYLVPLREGG